MVTIGRQSVFLIEAPANRTIYKVTEYFVMLRNKKVRQFSYEALKKTDVIELSLFFCFLFNLLPTENRKIHIHLLNDNERTDQEYNYGQIQLQEIGHR